MSWQATVATAADSCSGAMAVALVLQLWRLPWWRQRWVHGNLCMELDSKFCMIFMFLYVFGHFTTTSVQLIQLIIFGLFCITRPCIFGPKKAFCIWPLKKNSMLCVIISMSMLHVNPCPFPYPCCTSMYVHAACLCPCFMFISMAMLHVHVHAA
jgi:hypothetical protein